MSGGVDEDMAAGGNSGGRTAAVTMATLDSLERMTGIVDSMTRQLQTVNQALER